jgi:hypothetical protein
MWLGERCGERMLCRKSRPMRAKSIVATIKDKRCACMRIVLIKKMSDMKIPGKRMNWGIGR